jgi:hypothetical protein
MKPGLGWLSVTTLLLLMPGTVMAQRTEATSASPESPNDLKKDALFMLASRHTPESSQFLKDFYRRTTEIVDQ